MIMVVATVEVTKVIVAAVVVLPLYYIDNNEEIQLFCNLVSY